MQFLYSGHYYERQLTDYYYNDKLKIPPLSVFVSPYFIHGASCAMLNTDWTPLPVCLQGVITGRPTHAYGTITWHVKSCDHDAIVNLQC